MGIVPPSLSAVVGYCRFYCSLAEGFLQSSACSPGCLATRPVLPCRRRRLCPRWDRISRRLLPILASRRNLFSRLGFSRMMQRAAGPVIQAQALRRILLRLLLSSPCLFCIRTIRGVTRSPAVENHQRGGWPGGPVRLRADGGPPNMYSCWMPVMR